jgi:hypothetical protein
MKKLLKMRPQKMDGNAGTMRTGLLLTIALVVGFPASLAQSQSFQTSDPTAQAPCTLAPTPSVAAPLEVKQSGDGMSHSETTAAESLQQEKWTSFVGTIRKRRHAYVLKAADGEYLLNDRGLAKQYKGKRVKATGNSNENHVIRVLLIQLSPSE